MDDRICWRIRGWELNFLYKTYGNKGLDINVIIKNSWNINGQRTKECVMSKPGLDNDHLPSNGAGDLICNLIKFGSNWYDSSSSSLLSSPFWFKNNPSFIIVDGMVIHPLLFYYDDWTRNLY